jgi:ribosomal protein S18 acetylase RimI-like enzyme
MGMDINTINETFRFEILKEPDIEEAAHILTSSFTEDDKLTKYMGITSEEFKKFAYIICKNGARIGLSLIAREKSTNNIAACRIVENACAKNDELGDVSKKFVPIFSLLEKASSPLLKHIKKEEKVAHFVTLAVDKAYRGLGLSKCMLAITLHHLKNLGYKHFCGDFTNIKSQNAIKNIIDGDIDYENIITYREEGTLPLDGTLISCVCSVDKLKPDLKEWASQQKIIGA